LVERFPGVTEAQPELVAHHYTEAGLQDQAITFWHKAGHRAIQRSANLDAIGYLTRGLRTLNTQPENSARDAVELMLQTTLGPPLIACKGMAAPEVERTYERARELCTRVGDQAQLFPILCGLWWFYEVRADLLSAYTVAEQLLDIAQQLENAALLVQANRAMGQTLFWQGEFTSALAHFE
jgi:predicted ATPase